MNRGWNLCFISVYGIINTFYYSQFNTTELQNLSFLTTPTLYEISIDWKLQMIPAM